uniref:Uncharacterized protein n=1 Tax=Cacopsylla melanoneura TaxID=428564 RepID=A0A8D8LCA7_9HEMI
MDKRCGNQECTELLRRDFNNPTCNGCRRSYHNNNKCSITISAWKEICRMKTSKLWRCKFCNDKKRRIQNASARANAEKIFMKELNALKKEFLNKKSQGRTPKLSTTPKKSEVTNGVIWLPNQPEMSFMSTNQPGPSSYQPGMSFMSSNQPGTSFVSSIRPEMSSNQPGMSFVSSNQPGTSRTKRFQSNSETVSQNCVYFQNCKLKLHPNKK